MSNFYTMLWTVACQALLSMGFSKQEHWSGLPCLPPGDLPDPGIEPVSLTSPSLADEGFFVCFLFCFFSFLPLAPPGKPHQQEQMSPNNFHLDKPPSPAPSIQAGTVRRRGSPASPRSAPAPTVTSSSQAPSLPGPTPCLERGAGR